MKKDVEVFIDEFGNTHLDVERDGTLSHFIYTSLIIEQDKREEAIALLADIQREFFQASPMKFSRIKRDDNGFEKRKRILRRLIKLDFIAYSLIIDKKKIDGDGLKYKSVFYKYFSRIFITEIAGRYGSYRITADKLGGSEFQKSLVDFIYRNGVSPDLFNQDRSYRLADDKSEEPLLQLADFISGCIGLAFCTSHAHDRGDELVNLLTGKLIVDFFPHEFANYLGRSFVSEHAVDREIAVIALESATKAMDQGMFSTETRELLRYLLLVYRTTPDRLVETHELVERVMRVNPNYSIEAARQSIQELRDGNVLVSSIQGKSGYKIPNNLNDIIGFYNRYLSSIVPMLRRVKISEKILKMESLNQVEVLSEENNLQVLAKLLEVMR